MVECVSTKYGSCFILLTGAPQRRDLSWNEESLSGLRHGITTSRASESLAEQPVVWRNLDLERQRLHTGLSQPHFPVYFQGHQPASETNSDSMPRRSFRTSSSKERAKLTARRSSHSTRASFISNQTSISLDDSLWSTSTAPSQIQGPTLDRVTITPLVELPPAHQVEDRSRSELYNLLVTIHSIGHPQVVLFTKGKRQARLVRLVVGDDTKSTFELCIWSDTNAAMSPEQVEWGVGSEVHLQQVSDRLHRHDIVLFRNMSLRAFKDNVSASSTRSFTEIILLHRVVVHTDETTKPRYSNSRVGQVSTTNHVLERIKKILGWQDKYLTMRKANQTAVKRSLEDISEQTTPRERVSLPADTQ